MHIWISQQRHNPNIVYNKIFVKYVYIRKLLMVHLTLIANLVHIIYCKRWRNIDKKLISFATRWLFHTCEKSVSFNKFLTCLAQFILLGKTIMSYNIKLLHILTYFLSDDLIIFSQNLIILYCLFIIKGYLPSSPYTKSFWQFCLILVFVYKTSNEVVLNTYLE